MPLILTHVWFASCAELPEHELGVYVYPVLAVCSAVPGLSSNLKTKDISR